MVHKYPKALVNSAKQTKMSPSIDALKFILNYSKSIEVKTSPGKKLLLHLN